MAKFYPGELVQFTEGDKWFGAIGFISEIKEVGDDVRYMVGVNIPRNDGEGGVAYRFCMESRKEFEKTRIDYDECTRTYIIRPPFLPSDVMGGGGDD